MLAKPHLTFIGNDGVKPTSEVVRRLQLPKLPIGFYEHFLSYIFCFLVIAYLMISIGMHPFLMLADKTSKRRFITFQATTDEQLFI